MNIIRQTALIGCVSVSLAACASLENPSLVQDGVPVSQIIVTNKTSHPLLDVRIAPARDDNKVPNDFGFDRLDGDAVPVDGEVSFPASAGCYMVRTVSGPPGFFTLTRDEKFGMVCVAEDRPGQYYVR